MSMTVDGLSEPTPQSAPVAEAGSPRRLRTVALFALKIAISAVLLWWATRSVNFADVGRRLAQYDLRYLWIIAAIFAFHLYLSGLRWRLIADTFGRLARLKWYLHGTAVSYFFNQVMLGTVGGDVYRIIAMRRIGFTFGQSVTVILIERVAIMFVMALMVLATVPFIVATTHSGNVTVMALELTALLLVGLGMVYSLASHGIWDRLIPVPRLVHILRKLSRALMQTLKLPMAHMASFLVLSTSVIIYWLTAQALGYTSSLWLYALAMPTVILVSMVPVTIGGWGARELVGGTMLALLGGSFDEGVVVSAVVGISMVAVGIPGFFLWLAGAPDPGAR